MNKHGQTICLNMIVKNEAHVIRRCLSSVRPLIDYWVIVDTGSTDGTQEIIREHFKDLPGELIERPWVDFAHNRSEALARARGKADFVFVIDADETLEIQPGFEMPRLVADSYNVEVSYGGCTYMRKQLMSNALSWCYKGVVHEYIFCEHAHTEQFLPGLRTHPTHDGARARDPLTYRRDALMLEQAILEEPDNARYVFYLAQSYRDAGDLELALRHYKRRVEMGGWPEEVWYSLYQIAAIKERAGKDWGEVLQDYLAALQFKPERAETLYRIGVHYQAARQYHLSHLFFARAMRLPHPAGARLFVERAVYDFLLPVEYAVACFYVGEHGEALRTNNGLLRGRVLPPHAVEQVIKNRRFSLDVLFPPPDPSTPDRGCLKVCVPFRDPSSGLDETVDSLRRQSGCEFDAIFIDAGSSADHADRLMLDDPRFSLVRYDAPAGFEDCVMRFAGESCAPEDIVVPLRPGVRLADAEALKRIRLAFKAADCLLLYGQHRLPSGRLGDAEPAPDEETFNARGAALASLSPVIFRARLRDEHPMTETRKAAEGGGFFNHLHAAAGFRRTRFADEAWTVCGGVGAREFDMMTERAKLERNGQRLPPTLAALGTLPQVSCLMVTLDRLALAKRSIQCFAEQTYPNRELVIVTDGEPRFRRALERFVAEQGIERVHFVYPGEERLTLGRLRNISVEAAAGEIICQWDDDDCNHPERLALQIEHMLRQQARACFLTDHLQFLEANRTLFWIDWTLGGTISGKDQLVPGSLMMYKDERFRYPENGYYARQGEDSMLLESLYGELPVAHLMGMGHLYLYQYHGRNTFSKEHHYHMTTCAAPAAFLRARAETLRRAVTHYSVAKPLVVCGRDEPAFVLNE